MKRFYPYLAIDMYLCKKDGNKLIFPKSFKKKSHHPAFKEMMNSKKSYVLVHDTTIGTMIELVDKNVYEYNNLTQDKLKGFTGLIYEITGILLQDKIHTYVYKTNACDKTKNELKRMDYLVTTRFKSLKDNDAKIVPIFIYRDSIFIVDCTHQDELIKCFKHMVKMSKEEYDNKNEVLDNIDEIYEDDAEDDNDDDEEYVIEPVHYNQRPRPFSLFYAVDRKWNYRPFSKIDNYTPIILPDFLGEFRIYVKIASNAMIDLYDRKRIIVKDKNMLVEETTSSFFNHFNKKMMKKE